MLEKIAADWMKNEVEEHGYLTQQDAVEQLQLRFGDDLVYENENGGTSISPKVLREFKHITEDSVVWSREERCWLKRDLNDDPGRQQLT